MKKRHLLLIAFPILLIQSCNLGLTDVVRISEGKYISNDPFVFYGDINIQSFAVVMSKIDGVSDSEDIKCYPTKERYKAICQIESDKGISNVSCSYTGEREKPISNSYGMKMTVLEEGFSAEVLTAWVFDCSRNYGYSDEILIFVMECKINGKKIKPELCNGVTLSLFPNNT